MHVLSFQDENDNPPTFSKPAYFVSVLENIMAGTAGAGAEGAHSMAGTALVHTFGGGATVSFPGIYNKSGKSLGTSGYCQLPCAGPPLDTGSHSSAASPVGKKE